MYIRFFVKGTQGTPGGFIIEEKAKNRTGRIASSARPSSRIRKIRGAADHRELEVVRDRASPETTQIVFVFKNRDPKRRGRIISQG